MIRRIFIWVKISIFVLATTLLALITPASSSAAVQRLQDIPTSIITSTVSGPVQTFDSDDSSSPLGSEITSTGASQYQALLTSILPAMSTPLSAMLFSVNSSFNSISTASSLEAVQGNSVNSSFSSISAASLLETMAAKSAKIEALREAQFLMGEGDRAANKTAAREKWLAAADAFARAGDQLGAADAYLLLANSYQIEAILSPPSLKLAVEYYLKALTAGADVYEDLIQNELTFDAATLNAAQVLYERGKVAYEANDCRQAVPLLDEARQLYRQAKLGSGEVRVLTIKAICQMEAENYLGSLSTLLEGLLIAQSLPLGEPLTERYLEGQDRYERGDFAGALTIYEEVLIVYQERNDKASSAETMLNLGSAHAQLGEYAEAAAMYQQALELFVELKEENEAVSDDVDYAYADYNEAATLHNLGNLATINGQYDAAYTQFNQAIKIWQASGDPAHEVVSMSGLGLALRGQGKYAEGLTVLGQAWTQQQRLSPNLALEGDIRSNIGYIYFSQANFQGALEEFDRALQIRQQLDEPQRSLLEAETRSNIGAVYASLSRFDEALKTYQQALNQLPDNALSVMTASVRANMATIYVEQGNYQQGIATYIDILPELTDKNMEPMRAAMLQNLGTAYLRIGKLAEAEDYLLQAQAIFNATGEFVSVATIDNNLGLFYAQAGYPISATIYLEKALVVLQAEQNQAAVAKTLGNLALIAATGDDLAEAIAYGEEALVLSEMDHIRTDQARILVILGLIHLKMGDIPKALENGELARILSVGVGDLQTEVGSQILLAVGYLLQDDISQAYTQIETAIGRLEELQNRITISELKTAFLGQQGDIYDLAVLIALANHKPDQAFLYTEKARTQASLPLLGNRRVDFRQGAQAEMIEREQALSQQMVSLQSDLSTEKAKPLDQQRSAAIANLAEELDAARREQSQLLVELKVSNPAYADLISGAVLSLAEVQQTLDDQTTLIVYFLPNANIINKVLVWVIDQQAVTLVDLDITSRDLRAKVEFLHNQLKSKDRSMDADLDAALTPLYDSLFAPLKPYIHQQNLIIAPHASLHYLPFAALWNAEDSRYLIEDYAITYIPSASVLPLILSKRNPNQGKLLALGNPDGSLTYAEREVQQVADLYSGAPLLGKAATESTVIAQAAQADLIHLAAHGIYDPLNPLYTRIELAPDAANDGHLEVHEVLALNLSNANLIVLSGSEAYIGQQSRGDEIIGLTQAFLYAGAPSVITSLWNVNDVATSELMLSFYQHWQEDLTIAEALRLAQIDILSNDVWRSPFYWASFNLTGDYMGDEPELLEARKQLALLENQVQQNNYQQILAYLLKVLPVFVRYEFLSGQSRVHMSIGETYIRAGDLFLAERHFAQASDVVSKMDNSANTNFAQSSIGWLAAQSGNFTQAETQLQQALAIWKERKNPTATIQVLEKLALVSIAQGYPNTALALVQEASQQNEQAGTQIDQAFLLIISGIAWFKAKDYSKAITEANLALQLATEFEDQLSVLGSHTLLAMSYAADGKLEMAYEHLQQVMTQLETIQSPPLQNAFVATSQLQTIFLHQLTDINELAISLAIKLEQNDKAFQYAEQMQEHGFLELSNQRLDLRTNADPDLIRQEQALRQSMADLTKEIKPLESERSLVLSQLQNKLEAAQLDYAEIITLLRATSPDYVATLVKKPVTIERVQQELLDEQTILVKYAVMESETLAWVVDRTTVTLVHLPITRRVLENQIKFLRNSIDTKEFDTATAATLHTALIQPLKQYIRYSNLIIVSNDILQQLPFPALWDTENGRYLAQDYAITLIPSVSELEFIMGRRNPNRGKLLALGNPSGSLPFAKTEAEAIAKLYGGVPLLGQAASESQVYAQAGQIDILHLAALGVQNPLQPLFAYIELAPDNTNDGKLEVHEIYNQLDLKGVNLVVVTASDVRSTSADETTGFAQAFLYAGAPNVVTSQWTVDDQATAFLMEKFYTYLQDGIDTPEALHQAQIDTLQQPQYANPYYWAGFTLTGDYKNDYAVAMLPPSPWPSVIGVGSGLMLVLIAGFITLVRYSGLPIMLLLQQKSALPFIGLQYRSYRQRWENQAILTQLLLLLFPEEGLVDTKQLVAKFTTRAVPVEAEQIEQELNAIYRGGLLEQSADGYRLVEPRLNHVLQMHVGENKYAVLAKQIRNEHPLSVNAHRFFKQAGCILTLVAEPLIYRCESMPADLQRLLSTTVYVHLLPGQILDGEKIAAIQEQVKQINPTASLVLAVTDQRPTNDGWAQIGVLQMRGFTVLPLESALINEGIASGRERTHLRTELELRLGTDYDPYDIRNPVAGAFSFFGRDMLVDTLLRRITNGQPVGVFGLRKLGKTSLLHALRDRAPFPVAAVNLQAGGTYNRILRQWMQWARVHYQLEWQPPTIPEDSATNAFITATLDLLDQAARVQTNVRLGIFLDEVELIVPRADGSGPSLAQYLELFRALRGLIDEDGRLSLVVASLNPTLNRVNAWRGEQNPTFSLFQEINLPPLTHEDCKQMVLNIGQQIGLVYSDASLTAINALSGGHPFLARQLSSLLYKLRGRQVGQIEEIEIPPAAERFIYDDSTVQQLDEGIWQDVGNEKLWGTANAKINQSILLELARAGEPQPRHIILNATDADARQSALINLENFQVIHQPQPGVYAIQFGLLQMWLRKRVLGLS